MAARNRSSSFVFPLAGDTFTTQRTDQGKDYGNIRGRIGAIGPGVVTLAQNLSGFGQTIVEKLRNGTSVYYGLETGATQAPGIHVGQKLTAGQAIGSGTGSGGVEFGIWNPATGHAAGYQPGVTSGGVTPQGTKFANWMTRLQKNKGTQASGLGANSPRNNPVPTYVPKQYRSWVRNASASTGLPASIVAAQINMESGFDRNATSPTGAQGIAQFEPSTWQAQKVKGSPYDPQAALLGYDKLMGALLRQYNGNVRNALAAYNAGPGNLQAGYGYADAILAKAGAPRSVQAGQPSNYGGTRPGGQPATNSSSSSGSGGGSSDTGADVTQLFTDYDNELESSSAPTSTFSGKNPFSLWWQSFSGNYATVENQGNG